ncbi:MAG: MFS transporter [Planctomycetota bacterium]|jgi:SHS family sialic acid transporter-like MFS transporter|nr:MFS transporter [Planctomycetota bacterium]
MTRQIGRFGRNAALVAAILGWLFDGFEMGLFPLIGGPAIKDLLGSDAAPGDADKWFGAIIAVFLVGAATGGVLFGWLGDVIGRVRAMTLSILTYAVFTGLCGLATEAWHVAALRFIASLGMGGEWSLGVALVNEIWPGKSRALTAGLIGAAANVGFLLVALLSLGLGSVINGTRGLLLGVGLPESIVTQLVANSAWRLLMISGALPALLIFLIRIWVPESEKWAAQNQRGATSHWMKADLLGVLVGGVAALSIIWAWSPAGLAPSGATAVTVTGLVVAAAGYLFPVLRYLGRAEAAGSLPTGSAREVVKLMLFGAGLAGVTLLGTWGAIQWIPRWAMQLGGDAAPHAKEYSQIATAFGAIMSTFLTALVADRIGRRPTFALLCLATIAAALWLYQGHDSYGTSFLLAAFTAGGISASFYGFFPLYFPELFPTAVRATGQGFAFNFGRIIAAIGGLQTATLMTFFGGSFPKAGSVLVAIYLVGAVLVWFGPETKGRALPD